MEGGKIRVTCDERDVVKYVSIYYKSTKTIMKSKAKLRVLYKNASMLNKIHAYLKDNYDKSEENNVYCLNTL